MQAFIFTKEIDMRTVYITDLSIPELDPYSRLSEPELMHLYEPDGGVFIAETPMIIERALEAGYEPESMLVEEGCAPEAAAILERQGNKGARTDITIFTAPMDTIAQLTGYRLTRGMLAIMRRRKLSSVNELLGDKGQNPPRRIAVLEDVMNPTNVGAIFRSAAALGIGAILLTKGCSDPLYRRACRVGMGTAFLIPWTYFGEDGRNAAASDKEDGNQPAAYDYISELHRYGYKTVAMALRGDSVTIDDPVLSAEPRLAIILGTEGEGLRTETIVNSDYTVKIPMAAGVDSLNVAAASAVAFWELAKRKI